jgi:hypothetical protein
MLTREQLIEEQQLRKLVRKAIYKVYERKQNQKKNEDNQLRSIIQDLIKEAASDPEETPHKSTGINVLEGLLKKIIPVIEIDFKKLTTAQDQRDSYKAHILTAIENALAPARVMDSAPLDLSEQDIDVNITDADDEKFIDVRGEKEPEEEDENKSDAEKEGFALSGEDETGRDMAYSTFKSIETQVVDAFDLLSNNEDKELFYDYLITNVKLYFDKFEEEMAVNLEEPTTPEYEKAKKDNVEDTIEEPAGEEGGEEQDLADIAAL